MKSDTGASTGQIVEITRTLAATNPTLAGWAIAGAINNGRRAARRVYRLGETQCGRSLTEREAREMDKARGVVEACGAVLGLKTDYPGLWPTWRDKAGMDWSRLMER